MVVNRRVGKVKNFSLATAVAAAVALAGATYATSALADEPMLTKAAPMAYAPPPPAACGSVYDFFFTKCPLTWYGVTFFGTVDMGVTYQTHGTPFDKNFPTGASYFIGNTNRNAGFGLGPNGLSQSGVGFKVQEAIAPGWSFIAQGELAFDPYSALLANAPVAMQNAIGVAQNQALLPIDSSKWGWLAAQNYVGFSSPTFGTLTFGRQNALILDGIIAYDPMGASFAFSPIGYSGKGCGAGDTEECRWTTAIKYRVNVGDLRFAVIGQPLAGYGAYNPNTGAIEGDIGGDIKHLVPGVVSLDAIGSYVRDAVNIGPSWPGEGAINGWPQTFLPNGFLKATISNQTSFTALGKWSFGSVTMDPPIAVKGAPPPTPHPLVTLYAGYEWIQFAPPSDPQTAFYDDGFLFVNPNTTNTGTVPGFNATAINNNAYNAACGTGGGCKDAIQQIIWAGVKYGITRDLDVTAAGYLYIQNQYNNNVGNPCANPANSGTCAGTEPMASLLFDWRFLPKWDAYIGTFYQLVNGGFANGYLARNNVATTTGVRFRF